MPHQPGGGQDGPAAASMRRRLLAVVAVLVAVVAALVLASLFSAGGGSVPARPLSTSQIVARIAPSVVNVTSTLGYQHGVSAGTGIVLSSSGEILTNNHVIEGATAISVGSGGDGRTYQAVVAGYDVRHDIAVLRVGGASGLRAAPLGDSAQLGIGDKVVALGNAGGSGGVPAAVTGHVTGLRQTIVATNEASGISERLTGMIRTDAAIKAGYSGGPLADSAGDVVGMNTAGSEGPQSRSGQEETQAFAVPISQVRAVAGQILAGRGSAIVHIGPTAFLGVALLTSPGRRVSGAEVARVQAGSPAAAAGLTAGDAITSLAGRPVLSQADIQAVLVTHHPGDRVVITWTDKAGRARRASVVLATGPAA